MYLLSALAAGFVRGIYIDRLDKLSEGIGGQFRKGAVPLYPLNELLYIQNYSRSSKTDERRQWSR